MKSYVLSIFRSPRILAICYFGLIPLFAAIYCFMPGSFYHTTSQFEGSRANDVEQVRQVLNTTLKAQIGEANQTTPEARYAIDPESLVVSAVHLDKVVISFTAQFRCEDRQRHSVCFLSVPLRFNVRERSTVQSKNSVVCCYFLDADDNVVKSLSDIFDLTALYPVSSNFLAPHILVPARQVHTINEYVSAMNGQPGYDRGWGIDNFVRMLYFSASTVTTTGYGDIVPLSSMTRCLAMLESILGIILIGLFLSVLAGHVSTGRRDTDTAKEDS